MLDIVIDQIPSALGTVAKNYAAADNSSCGTVNAGTVTKVTTIPDSDTSTMAFDSASATTAQQNVSMYLDGAVTLMNDIQRTFNLIEWESEAAYAMNAKIVELKQDIVDAIDTIKTEFTTLMQQSQEDIEAAETSNTVE